MRPHKAAPWGKGEQDYTPSRAAAGLCLAAGYYADDYADLPPIMPRAVPPILSDRLVATGAAPPTAPIYCCARFRLAPFGAIMALASHRVICPSGAGQPSDSSPPVLEQRRLRPVFVMDVIVIGGGVAGVTTAHALRAAGHQVCVIERHTTLAQEATFGRDSLMLPNALGAWFGPGVPATRAWLGLGRMRGHHGLLLRAGIDRELRSWVRHWRAERKPERFSAQYGRLRALSELSMRSLTALETARGLEFEQRTGVLHLFAHAHDLKQAATALSLLKEPEHPHRIMSAAQCVALEPSIPAAQPLAGGVLLPADRSANCPLFAKQFKQLLADTGVTFRLESTALSIQMGAGGARVKLASQHPDTLSIGGEEELRADAVVLAAGAGSLPLLAQAGIRLPLQAVRLHALMAPILHEELAPHITLVDSARRITIARLNNRMKITGAAVLQGHAKILRAANPALRAQALDMLAQAAHNWAPGAVKFSSARHWDGVSLLSPDGLPVVSRTVHPRLYVNLAHGPVGWALSSGSATLLAELLSGQPSDEEFGGLITALDAGRFSR
jgi:D-amino-acid dehydrogenase